MAVELDERAQRIVDTAVALAERDGFAAVRLRDVAATANVALGTVARDERGRFHVTDEQPSLTGWG